MKPSYREGTFQVILWHKSNTTKGKPAISFHPGLIEGPIKEALNLFSLYIYIYTSTSTCQSAIPCPWEMQASSSELWQSRSVACSWRPCFRESTELPPAFISPFCLSVVVSSPAGTWAWVNSSAHLCSPAIAGHHKMAPAHWQAGGHFLSCLR